MINHQDPQTYRCRTANLNSHGGFVNPSIMESSQQTSHCRYKNHSFGLLRILTKILKLEPQIPPISQILRSLLEMIVPIFRAPARCRPLRR